jgi:hypothetical protein
MCIDNQYNGVETDIGTLMNITLSTFNYLDLMDAGFIIQGVSEKRRVCCVTLRRKDLYVGIVPYNSFMYDISYWKWRHVSWATHERLFVRWGKRETRIWHFRH